MKRILSRANETYKSLRSLAHSARERHARRQTLLDGPHLVRTYLETKGQPNLVAVSDDALQRAEIAELLKQVDATRVLLFPHALFTQLASVEAPAGILASIDIPSRPDGSLGELVVLLESIQDPGNVGAIIRTAAAAGADSILTCPKCADPWSPRALRAGMGATFAVAIRTGMDLVQSAAKFPGQVVATAGRGGVAPSALNLTGQLALLFGSEGDGLSEPLAACASATASIPLARNIESLNVAAAAAVLMFERVRQLAIDDEAKNIGDRG